MINFVDNRSPLSRSILSNNRLLAHNSSALAHSSVCVVCCCTATGCPVKCSCSHQNGGTAVDCSARHLSAAPDRLPKDTVALFLKDNRISSLSDHDLANCTRLQVLDLSQNGMNQLGQNAFLSTTNLQELVLNDNNISIFSLPLYVLKTYPTLKFYFFTITSGKTPKPIRTLSLLISRDSST